MSCHRIEHWGASAMRNVAVLVSFAAALLWPASASAVPNVLGLYRGFSQSDLDPRQHPRMDLMVDRQDAKGNFFGTLLMGTPGGQLPFTFQGKLVNEQGGFKGKGTGPAGDVTFTGIVQDLGDQGGALVLATYKFTFPDGSVDKGTTRLLRSFPPDPTVPDITGDWSGTTRSDLTGQPMDITLQITSQHGASFEGTEIVAGWHSDAIVGTIGVRGNFVYIGVSSVEQVLVGGQHHPPDPTHPPDPFLDARYVRNLPTGAVDLGTFMVTPAVR